MQRRTWLTIICFCLMGAGWLVSGYLLLRVYALSGSGVHSKDVCSAVFGASCDHSLSSSDSFQLGIHLAAWGLLYFAVLGFVMVLALKRTTLLISSAGSGASLVLIGVLLLTHDPVCYLCLLVHTMNLLLLCVLYFSMSDWAAPATEREVKPATPFPWRRWAFSALVLGAAAQAGLWRFDDSGKRRHANPKVILAEYRAAQVREVPVNAGDPRLGPADAPVQMVVFSSFQCPGCRNIAGVARELSDQFGTKLSVVFKHFPLSSQCNPKSKSDFQPQSCPAAFAAEAAHSQGHFWAYHDLLFEHFLVGQKNVFEDIAVSLDLDFDQWQASFDSEETASKVRQDISFGLILGVDETPSIFLNGRRVRRVTNQDLGLLIKEELDSLQK